MICHVPGYERKKADINTQRQVVWIAKASNVPQVPGARGYDTGKKISGRKRHIFVDTMGLVLMVLVTVADV
uniref:Transposase IS4-like domain-containing protein n=1 Tax=Candidatus Kentrum eta TaxID=2126337 RepID=A0A450VQB2_9GAMM|nr:MAG: hypothetical protein BECKH772B_GA0070898_102871 [Candidatus Kentron sp. H]VFK02737.1 MAG: hypothetical protein BECKH772A_GA0070896_102841 [Candidatus Kentron sp. H]VFK03933.1 MAG: hypothetical protein BECKH772B_GA0070898_103923 [Candidatus Kentron sp. H]VFK04192.1 MAG: hypothetical protein BECKH772A_GA0070896_103903 [Candidatus Kentron sp. H]VFK06983.1 MAG: hypothetical protein BECKH772C_GA0070978_103883 [Candidatus Kentron sp. H]